MEKKSWNNVGYSNWLRIRMSKEQTEHHTMKEIRCDLLHTLAKAFESSLRQLFFPQSRTVSKLLLSII